MIFFVVFVLAAVLIGVGAMLAPALPTEQPRIGLASALTLILVITGGTIWTQFIGWDTLVIDYLLFGMVSVVILGGTMMQAHQEATSDEVISESVDWMNRYDFIFLMLLGIGCLSTLLFPYQPLFETIDFTYGQTLSEIELLNPDISQRGATGFYVLVVYLSQQLQQDGVIVQQAVTIVLMFLCVLVAYDLGSEAKNTIWGRLFAVGVFVLFVGIYLMQFSLGLSPLLLLILLANLFFAVRFVRSWQPSDVLGFILLLVTFFLL